MGRILRIDASSRVRGSHSRELADFFLEKWLERHPDDEVVVRDVVTNPVQHITDDTIRGFYTPPDRMDARLKAATALSDQLIAELKSSDVLLISVPIYNFSVPSAFKAYIDQIARVDRTFSHDGAGFTGLVTDKRAFVILAYGAAGYLGGGPLASLDHLAPYLTVVLNFLGITDVITFAVEATTADDATVRANRLNAMDQIARAIAP